MSPPCSAHINRNCHISHNRLVNGLHRESPEGATGQVGDIGSPGIYGSEVKDTGHFTERIYRFTI